MKPSFSTHPESVVVDAAELRVTAHGPASLSNLGPGFDALGLCLAGLEDEVTAWRTDAPGITVEIDAGSPYQTIPAEPSKNTAALAAQAVLAQAGVAWGATLRIKKGIVPGSGVGSSAASAVAGAWAANQLLDEPLPKTALVEAVLTGEAVASGCRHGDNVLPALFGGLVLVSPTDPTTYRPIPLVRELPVALLQPEVKVLTKEARALLPTHVPLHDAVRNAADLAFLLDAYRAGDWQTVGAVMMRDRLVEPVRATLVPCYEAVRSAALEAGAYGCALSGSGPALFAIAETEAEAATVLQAMQAASEAIGIGASGHVTRANARGVWHEAA